MGRARAALTYMVLGLWGLISILPLYWLVLTSIKSGADFVQGPRYLPFVDFVPDFSAWRFVLFEQSGAIYPRFANSLIVAAGASLLSVMAGAMLVYGATRFPTRRSFLQGRVLIPAMIATRILPPLVVVLPLSLMAQLFRVADTRSLLVLVYAAVHVPVAAWLAAPAFGSRRSDQEEAAVLDGAPEWLIFGDVVLPMMAPALMAIAVVVFVLCWNEYLFAVFLTSDHALTLPPFLVGQMSVKEAQAGAEVEEWGRFSAATVLMVLPPLALSTVALSLLRQLPFWRGIQR